MGEAGELRGLVVDGKTLRDSGDEVAEIPIWQVLNAVAHQVGAVIASQAVFSQTNELEAMPDFDGDGSKGAVWVLAIHGSEVGPLIPTDGLRLWLDAEDTNALTESGGSLSVWSDKSNQGHHLIQANSTLQPQVDSTGFDGKTEIDFSLGDVLATDSEVNIGVSPTIFLVGRWGSQGTMAFLKDTQPGVEGDHFFARSINFPAFGRDSGTSWANYSLVVSVPPAPGTKTLLSYWSEGNTLYGRVNDTDYSRSLTVPLSPNNLVDYLELGGNSPIWRQFDGSLAEIVIYDRPLTPTERSQVESYLSQKWSVP